MLSFSMLDFVFEESAVGATRQLKNKKNDDLEYFKKTIKVNNKKVDFYFARDKKTNIIYPQKIKEKNAKVQKSDKQDNSSS